MSKQLVKEAGKSVQEECRKFYKNGINIGDIAITSAGDKIFKWIFHVALYTYWVNDGNISAEVSLLSIAHNLNNMIGTRVIITFLQNIFS